MNIYKSGTACNVQTSVNVLAQYPAVHFFLYTTSHIFGFGQYWLVLQPHPHSFQFRLDLFLYVSFWLVEAGL